MWSIKLCEFLEDDFADGPTERSPSAVCRVIVKVLAVPFGVSAEDHTTFLAVIGGVLGGSEFVTILSLRSRKAPVIP
jgi:hypothetical protein